MKQQPLVVVHRKAFLAIVDHLWDLLGFAVNDILIFADRDSSDAEYRVTFVPVAQSPVQKHWPNGYSTVLSASVLEDPTSSGMKVFLSELTESLKKAFSDGEYYCDHCRGVTPYQRVQWPTDPHDHYIGLVRCLECGHGNIVQESEPRA